MKKTKVRLNIIDCFKNNSSPLSYDEIINFLIKKKIKFNRSTVFRNLNFLVKNGFLIKVNFGDGKVRYELKDKDNHHHHLICERCQKVIDFYDKNLDLLISKLEKKFSQEKRFQIFSHQMDFFGICPRCKT